MKSHVMGYLVQLDNRCWFVPDWMFHTFYEKQENKKRPGPGKQIGTRDQYYVTGGNQDYILSYIDGQGVPLSKLQSTKRNP